MRVKPPEDMVTTNRLGLVWVLLASMRMMELVP
jgi:hypothetical protein